jgi:thiamine biosynthesis lipoprotein
VSTHRFSAMGCEVVVGGATAAEAAAVERLFEALETSLSRFRPDSDLERLNRSPAEAAIVSPLLATALDDALRAAAASSGLCDPTIAAALDAAGYDRTFAEVRRTELRDPVPAGRWREVRVSGLLVRRPPGLRLDLNGVVKGRAVDDALALIEGAGFVSAGGDLATRGELVVGLPGGDTVTLQAGGLATSGVTTRSWEREDGARAHHLIDPSSGAPATSRWECVTVCAASCLAADVAAKTAFLLGDQGPGWLESRGLQGRFVSPADGVVLAGGWPASAGRAETTACI